MWLLVDLILAVLLVLFAVRGFKKGLIKSLCGALVTVVAAVIALNFSAPVAEYFRSTFVYKQLTDNLNEKVEAYVNTITPDSLGTLLEDEPTGLSSLLAGFGMSTDSVRERYEELMADGETQIASALSDYIVEPAAKTVSDALAVLAVFVVSLIALNLLILLLDLIFKLPLLSAANRLGGLVFGLLTGFLAALVFCTVVHIALPYLPGLGIALDSEGASGALLFSWLSSVNPLAFLYQ